MRLIFCLVVVNCGCWELFKFSSRSVWALLGCCIDVVWNVFGYCFEGVEILFGYVLCSIVMLPRRRSVFLRLSPICGDLMRTDVFYHYATSLTSALMPPIHCMPLRWKASAWARVLKWAIAKALVEFLPVLCRINTRVGSTPLYALTRAMHSRSLKSRGTSPMNLRKSSEAAMMHETPTNVGGQAYNKKG